MWPKICLTPWAMNMICLYWSKRILKCEMLLKSFQTKQNYGRNVEVKSIDPCPLWIFSNFLIYFNHEAITILTIFLGKVHWIFQAKLVISVSTFKENKWCFHRSLSPTANRVHFTVSTNWCNIIRYNICRITP